MPGFTRIMAIDHTEPLWCERATCAKTEAHSRVATTTNDPTSRRFLFIPWSPIDVRCEKRSTTCIPVSVHRQTTRRSPTIMANVHVALRSEFVEGLCLSNALQGRGRAAGDR